MNNKNLIVILGPTASGKTNASIHIAEKLHTEIISADSRQFYKEMNIGVAKPDVDFLKRVKHHFINCLSIHDNYNVGMFENDAIKCLSQIFFKNDMAVMVGGSGLFIDSVCKGLDRLPDANENIRAKLNMEFNDYGLLFLQNKLKKLDSEYYKKVDLQNPRRIIRALEVCIASGNSYSSFKKKDKPLRPFSYYKVGILTEREVLYDRINKRVDTMITNGLVEEVKNLLPYKNFNPLQTIGYSELFDYFEGKCTLQEAVIKIKQNSRNYAKRQMTWFKKDKEIRWLTENDLKYEIEKIFLKKN